MVMVHRPQSTKKKKTKFIAWAHQSCQIFHTEHFSLHGLWLSAALCFPTDVSGPTRQQWSISNGSKNLIHPPLCFVRLSCKNNEALFLEDNIQREPCIMRESTSSFALAEKRWLMSRWRRTEIISRLIVWISGTIVVNCPTDDLCIVLWISVFIIFPNSSDREI